MIRQYLVSNAWLKKKRFLGSVILVLVFHQLLISPQLVQASTSPSNTFAKLQAQKQAHRLHNNAVIPVDINGFSGDSETSDAVNGLGDDQWQTNFKSPVKLTITVTDCCIVGDNFNIYVDGKLIGTTPQEPLYGSASSSGTFSQTVPAGVHLITISDPGAILYYNQGNTFMIPAGYSVTIAVKPVNHPILFVHGIAMSSTDVSADFGPIYTQLNSIYGPLSPSNFFQYVDDKSLSSGGICPPTVTANYPPCVSQSPVLANAIALAAKIQTLYTGANPNHKVALIGYSMGAAIIRTALANCPDPSTGRLLCSGVSTMVDDVFFVNGVQQGSVLMAMKEGLNIASLRSPVALAINLASYALVKGTMHLDEYYPAETDLTPSSDNIVAHNAVAPPQGINYFNFFGNIKVRTALKIFTWQLKSGALPLGDYVLLPGSDNPQATPILGGARFCAGCGNQDSYTSTQVDSTTSYSQWPLTDIQEFNINQIAGCLSSLGLSMSSACASHTLGNLANAPEWHLNVLHASGSIQVQDQTGQSSTASVAQEMLWQLEKGDGIL